MLRILAQASARPLMDIDQSFRPVVALVAAVAIGLDAANVSAIDLRVARYSEFSSLPIEEQRDPLLSLVRTRVPDELIQMGDAVDWLLEPSGYRLAPAANAPPQRSTLMTLPLPEVHRSLQGLPLRTALRTLIGPAFTLVEDPVHRLVSFEPCGFFPESL